MHHRASYQGLSIADWRDCCGERQSSSGDDVNVGGKKEQEHQSFPARSDLPSAKVAHAARGPVFQGRCTLKKRSIKTRAGSVKNQPVLLVENLLCSVVFLGVVSGAFFLALGLLCFGFLTFGGGVGFGG